MPSSTTPRIVRGPAPKKTYTDGSYRKAIEYLLRDTGGRCAYSMQHEQLAGGRKCMEVDHFKPKGKNRHRYANFLPATRHCNGAKSQTWPTIAEQRAGLRFLNPTIEQDYGLHIFEDATTHELIGATSEGRFQIEMCDLNAPHLVRERKDRSDIKKVLENTPVTVAGVVNPSAKGFMGALDALSASLRALQKELALKIPPIPPPPDSTPLSD